VTRSLRPDAVHRRQKRQIDPRIIGEVVGSDRWAVIAHWDV